MIADEDVAQRFDELRHVLKHAMMRTGVLGTVRAQLRLSALEMLKGTDIDNSNGSGSGCAIAAALGTHQVPPPETPEHSALLLVYDFLHHFPSLKRSAGIFAEESGLGSMRGAEHHFQDSKGLADAINVPYTTEDFAAEKPLLVSVVEKAMNSNNNINNDNSSAARQQQAQRENSPEMPRQDLQQVPSPVPSPTKQQRTEPLSPKDTRAMMQQLVTTNYADDFDNDAGGGAGGGAAASVGNDDAAGFSAQSFLDAFVPSGPTGSNAPLFSNEPELIPAEVLRKKHFSAETVRGGKRGRGDDLASELMRGTEEGGGGDWDLVQQVAPLEGVVMLGGDGGGASSGGAATTATAAAPAAATSVPVAVTSAPPPRAQLAPIGTLAPVKSLPPLQQQQQRQSAPPPAPQPAAAAPEVEEDYEDEFEDEDTF